MAGRKDIVGKALKVAADYFAPNTDEYAANLSKFYGSTDPALRKRFYTGTSKDKDFTAFQESRHGTWLTDDPEDASSYALNNDSQNLRLVPGTWNYEAVNSASRVIPSYARIENPYRGDKPDWVMKQDNYKKAQSDWFDQLRSQGYDAWVPDSSNGSLAVVLKNQGTNVKSAIGNQGTFDTTKKHMGKSEGGRTGYQTKGRVVDSVVGDAVDAAMRLIAGAEPQKTVKAYKLFKQEGGKLYPLFVGANEEVPMNQWVKATAGPQAASGKVKSKIGELAYRPGWHAGDLPIATHIGAKSHGDPSLPPDTRPSNQVWGEVEMANDVDWQKVANERARITKKGTPDPKTAHITDQVPYGGYYRYKTNPNMTGEWLIGGDMRVNRVLTDDEVKAINEAAGVSDLPRREGYGPGGVIDDIVKMAGKIVSGADEPAKTGMVRGTFPGSKMPSVDALSRNVDKFVYHSGTAKDIPEMKYGVSPQIGPWVREVLEGSADDDAIDEIMENAVPVSWWSKEPSWAVVKVARELGKPIDQVTPEDLASYGHVALIPKKDPEAESLYWVGKEGLNMGPYSDVEDITGRKVKAYDADLYSGNYGPEGVERNEYITTKTVEPYLHLTGNELVDFLRKTGQYKKASGGRAGYGGGGVSTDNNSVSGALNVARGLQGGM